MDESVDIVLVGAGVMSATLATLLQALEPESRIEILERLDTPASESSFAWNNAGTGHAALCELNYTPQAPDGSINIDKAISINTMFEESKQFWSYFVEQGDLGDPADFIHPVPHMSFVRGESDANFLRARHEALQAHHCFEDMSFTEDREQIRAWAPLLLEGRSDGERLAATRSEGGTDVDFGAVTRMMLKRLEALPDEQVKVSTGQSVTDLSRESDGRWKIESTTSDGRKRVLRSRFVFLGAGGAALHLLQKSDIPEASGYGGFPVSGQWLRCDKPEIVKQHLAKVYSKASVGSPPMSVPHLDTRNVDGSPSLLFGPYAGFTTKFLKTGSVFDLVKSVSGSNLSPMLSVARNNFDLVKYLVEQVRQTHSQRVDALRDFYPDARDEDWRIEVAGQRVQIIKKDPEKGGILQFGTEVVAAGDGSLAALLGASPGASTATSIMLGLLERCFPEKARSPEWQAVLNEIVPVRAGTLATDADQLRQVRHRTHQTLKINDPTA
ncbi:malate dehydrogenase (quinone) [Larsenimonas rhizosphaerae]|uniref:Probable malate:quinone oxidoreductase n=1 Tax=Larsenimonas rhizosphaerae TaxID=2944682 RepID=A0AA41ZHK0_9GAMM|nr:malate dehydrogenase (quinone) [Larsenimonas rhizosphaerae]MCM2131792.1 malate dehydrogenase (quinone) [Larsenimonas rhizosphaerae]MCX2524892.1 malate dehydrogenase (quinone) [Larsenimonas rhizosphaerae]